MQLRLLFAKTAVNMEICDPGWKAARNASNSGIHASQRASWPQKNRLKTVAPKEADQHPYVIPISIPDRKRSLILGQADQ